jgi:uncharacterized protein (DUF2141 family)
MMHRMTKMRVLVVLALAAMGASQVLADVDTDLTVNFTSVTNAGGKLYYSLYSTEDSYNREQGEALGGTTAAQEGMDTLVLHHMRPGFYALTVFHDENGNGKLDTNFLGQPKEQFGISNISRTLWSKPKWDEVKFEVKAGEMNALSVLLKMQ